MIIADILLEYDRSKTAERLGPKLLSAVLKDQFFYNKIQELSDDQKLDNILSALESMDPTANKKYVQWLAVQYSRNQFRVEDAARILDALTKFVPLQTQIKRAGHSTDINQYSWHDFESMIDSLTQVDIAKTDEPQLDQDPEAQFLYNGPYGKLLIPKTKAASCRWGSGTKWCTAGKTNNMFSEYNRRGPLYIWIDRTGEKYQFHFGKDGEFQLRDSRDQELSKKKIQEFRTQHPVLSKFFTTIESKILQNPTQILSYVAYVLGTRWPQAEPMLLKQPALALEYTMITRKRWPQAEPLFLKKAAMAVSYATHVLHRRWPEAEPYILKDPVQTSKYAVSVIDGRWPEAESIIMKSPQAIVEYAADVLEDRWPEAEKTVLQDPIATVDYANQVLGKRWKEAEPYIMKNPVAAVRYAEDVLEERWTAAEKYIKTNPELASEYANLFGFRFKAAEPYIMKDPHGAYQYATSFDKRWPAAEKYIMKDPEYAYRYARDIIGGKWPAAEKYIMSDPVWAKKYSKLI